MRIFKLTILLPLFIPVLIISCFNNRERLPAPVTYSSCSDGIKNGTESDVDCGGSCPGCYTTPTCSIEKNRYTISDYRTTGYLNNIAFSHSDGLYRLTGRDLSYSEVLEISFLNKPEKSANYQISTDYPTANTVRVNFSSYSYDDHKALSGTVHVEVINDVIKARFCSIQVKEIEDGKLRKASAYIQTTIN